MVIVRLVEAPLARRRAQQRGECGALGASRSDHKPRARVDEPRPQLGRRVPRLVAATEQQDGRALRVCSEVLWHERTTRVVVHGAHQLRIYAGKPLPRSSQGCMHRNLSAR
eukprot:990885-Prymnesium_polylepis.1